jgi:LacI family transcriptional regulator
MIYGEQFGSGNAPTAERAVRRHHRGPGSTDVKRVSQKKIADAAGVSQATVSLVLSGQPVASIVTRDRVLRAAEQLRYRPNLLVRGMQTGRTQTIGVMVPPFNFYWAEVLYGIHDGLLAADHIPITLWSAHKRSGTWRRSVVVPNMLEQVHRLLDRRVDGVILWPPMATVYERHVEEFSARDLPVVTIDHRLPSRFQAGQVVSDEPQGAALVAEHLLRLGHRRIGYLAAPATASWAVARRDHFERAVGRSATVTVETNPTGEPHDADGPARRLLDRPDRPTAVVAASDLFAKVVYRACRALRLRIPQDVSVVGFSDDDFAAEMDPPLTTVRQPAYDIGRVAAEVVLARCGERSPQAVADRVLPVSLIVRQSTAAPR